MTVAIEKYQIKLLHVLASKLGLTDGEYRAMLAGYPSATRDSFAASSKELSSKDAKKLIAELETRAIARGVWEKPTSRSQREGIKTNNRSGQRGIMASQRQIDKMESLWSLASKLQDAEARSNALNVFIHKRFHRGGIRMVERALVHKIVKAIEAMIQQKEKKHDTAE